MLSVTKWPISHLLTKIRNYDDLLDSQTRIHTRNPVKYTAVNDYVWLLSWICLYNHAYWATERRFVLGSVQSPVLRCVDLVWFWLFILWNPFVHFVFFRNTTGKRPTMGSTTGYSSSTVTVRKMGQTHHNPENFNSLHSYCFGLGTRKSSLYKNMILGIKCDQTLLGSGFRLFFAPDFMSFAHLEEYWGSHLFMLGWYLSHLSPSSAPKYLFNFRNGFRYSQFLPFILLCFFYMLLHTPHLWSEIRWMSVTPSCWAISPGVAFPACLSAPHPPTLPHPPALLCGAMLTVQTDTEFVHGCTQWGAVKAASLTGWRQECYK